MSRAESGARDRRSFLAAGLAVGASLAGIRASREVPVEAGEPPPRTAGPAAKPDHATPRFNGKDLAGWRAADEFVFKRHGAVEWRDGVVRLGRGDPGTAIVWTGAAPPTSDYEISLEVRRMDGDDFPCGLTFPVGRGHCTLIVGGWGGSVSGLSNIDDFPAVENETTGVVEIEARRWHAVRLRVTEREIRAWFDRQKIVDVDPRGKRFGVWWEQEPCRPLGVASWNTAAELRNFRFIRTS